MEASSASESSSLSRKRRRRSDSNGHHSGRSRQPGGRGAGGGDRPRNNNESSQQRRQQGGAENGAITTAAVTSTTKILPWPDPVTHYIPLHEEERLLPALIHWKKSERGMMKDQPPFRLQKLQKLLNQKSDQSHRHRNNSTMSLIQSLSLRRTHLKLLHPNLSMSQLRLGSQDDIRHSAVLFEQSIKHYLTRHNILHFFMTEEDQRRTNHRRKMMPTPDFRIREGYRVKLDFFANNNLGTASSSNNNNTTTPTIHWIEAKMFYGASTIPSNTPNAVGTILPKMQEYVNLYGTGAIVFMYGCGDVLARQLLELGVIALDGRGLELRIVEEYQRTWCADALGNILF